MLKKFASCVLAAFRSSTYRSVRLASSLTAALLDGLFEHPAWRIPVIPDVQTSEIPACHRVFPQLPLALCGGQVLDQITEGLVLHEALKRRVLAWIGHPPFSRIPVFTMDKRCLERLHRMIEVVHFRKNAG